MRSAHLEFPRLEARIAMSVVSRGPRAFAGVQLRIWRASWRPEGCPDRIEAGANNIELKNVRNGVYELSITLPQQEDQPEGVFSWEVEESEVAEYVDTTEVERELPCAGQAGRDATERVPEQR